MKTQYKVSLSSPFGVFFLFQRKYKSEEWVLNMKQNRTEKRQLKQTVTNLRNLGGKSRVKSVYNKKNTGVITRYVVISSSASRGLLRLNVQKTMVR